MKTCKCVGCGAIIPANEAGGCPFYAAEVLCAVCERELMEEEQRRHEDEDATEVERAYRESRESRYLWE